jgi:adenylate cyclase
VALFPAPAQGIAAGNDILHALDEYNLERYAKSLTAVRVGIGCHTGTLMLGTVGDTLRMDGIAIGNVISLSSQVEMCTKVSYLDII